MRIIKLKIAPLSRTIPSKMNIIQCMFNVSFPAFPIHCYVSRNNSLAITKRKYMVNAYVGIKLNVPYTYSIYIYIACSSYALPIREFSCFSLSLSPGFGHLNQELKYCNCIRPSAHRLFQMLSQYFVGFSPRKRERESTICKLEIEKYV